MSPVPVQMLRMKLLRQIKLLAARLIKLMRFTAEEVLDVSGGLSMLPWAQKDLEDDEDLKLFDAEIMATMLARPSEAAQIEGLVIGSMLGSKLDYALQKTKRAGCAQVARFLRLVDQLFIDTVCSVVLRTQASMHSLFRRANVPRETFDLELVISTAQVADEVTIVAVPLPKTPTDDSTSSGKSTPVGGDEPQDGSQVVPLITVDIVVKQDDPLARVIVLQPCFDDILATFEELHARLLEGLGEIPRLFLHPVVRMFSNIGNLPAATMGRTFVKTATGKTLDLDGHTRQSVAAAQVR